MSQNDWNLTQIDPTRKVTNVLCVRRIRSQVSSLAPIQEMTQSHTKQRIKEYEWNATHLQQNVSEFSQKLVLSHIKNSALEVQVVESQFFPLILLISICRFKRTKIYDKTYLPLGNF